MTAVTPVSLNGVSALSEVNSTTRPVSSGVDAVGKSFEDILSSLNDSQLNADDLVNKLAVGDSSVDLHDVMIGLEENDINFQVALSIRDKLVEAYQEIMRMQV